MININFYYIYIIYQHCQFLFEHLSLLQTRFQAVKLSRWQTFMTSLNLDTRVDFEEGDIGLAGGAGGEVLGSKMVANWGG